MTRRRLSAPTAKMVDRAIRTLAVVVDDDDAPIHARVTSGRALLARIPKDDERDPKGNPDDARHTVLVLPDNGRSGSALGDPYHESDVGFGPGRGRIRASLP